MQLDGVLSYPESNSQPKTKQPGINIQDECCGWCETFLAPCRLFVAAEYTLGTPTTTTTTFTRTLYRHSQQHKPAILRHVSWCGVTGILYLRGFSSTSWYFAVGALVLLGHPEELNCSVKLLGTRGLDGKLENRMPILKHWCFYY